MTKKTRDTIQVTDLTEYHRLRRAIAGEELPLALVDLDAFDQNLEVLVTGARAHRKKIRLASKSIRSVPLLQRAIERGGDTISGVMAFTVREAAFLVEKGINDLFIAYPTASPQDAETLAELNRRDGVRVGVVVDCEEHLTILSQAGGLIPVIVDVDVSLRLARGGVHIGVRRSPISDPDDVVSLVEKIDARQGVSFLGLMAYEAQVAGLTDKNPFTRLLNPVKAGIRRRSVALAKKRRQQLAGRLLAAGHPITIFNGGGTGSLSYTASESAVTEVAAGSGLLAGHLFDYYSNISPRPSAYFAVQVVRRPGPGFITCLGGGYVASGEVGLDKLPIPVLPAGLRLTPFEAAGEVQTPLSVPKGLAGELNLGDPVFFRHAKSGEIAERFDSFLLVRGDELVGRAATYRGEGGAFL